MVVVALVGGVVCGGVVVVVWWLWWEECGGVCGECVVVVALARRRLRPSLLPFGGQGGALGVSYLVWAKTKVRKKESGGTLDQFLTVWRPQNASKRGIDNASMRRPCARPRPSAPRSVWEEWCGGLCGGGGSFVFG